MLKQPIGALIAVLSAVVIGCAGGGAEEGAADEAPDGSLQEAVADAAGAYYLGSSFEELPLTAVLLDGPGEASFIYGDCEVPVDRDTGLAEGGCPPPLEIQTWSVCDRWPEAGARLVPFRGALGAFESPHPKLFHHHEIVAGGETIVVFAHDSDLARRAAERVWPAGGEPRADLPPPAPGAARGRLPCQETPRDLWDRTFISTAVTEGGDRRPLTGGTRIRVTFEEREDQGRVGWRAGCNRFGADVEITAERLLVDKMISGTLMGCGDDLEEQDRWLAGFFDQDPRWQLSDGSLTLTSGEAVIELEARR